VHKPVLFLSYKAKASSGFVPRFFSRTANIEDSKVSACGFFYSSITH
jgi:hypothetical protein